MYENCILCGKKIYREEIETDEQEAAAVDRGICPSCFEETTFEREQP